jgi:EmrB/QacA subfamily drug resistance transporter
MGAVEHAPDLRRAYLVLAVVAITGFQTAMALSIVFVAYPDIRAAFPGSSPTELSWVLNTFSIVGAPTMVLGGAVTERIGRKRGMLLGTAAFTLASVLAALAPSPAWIIVARALMAIAASFILPVSAALIMREFPESHRGVAMGLWSAAGGIAGAAGPSLGGWLIDAGGWPWAFWINVPFGIIGLIAGAVVLRESRDEERRPWPDAIGALLLMAGVGAIVLALVQTRDWGWGDLRVVALMITGVLFVVVLALRSRHHARPIVQPQLFASTPYLLGNVMMLFFSISFFGFQFVGVQFLTGPWGYDITTAGLLSTPMFLLIALMGPIAGKTIDRIGSRLLAPCALVWTLSLVAFAVLLDGERDLVLWWAFVAVGGTSSGFVWGALFAVIMKSVPPTEFSGGASVTQTLQRIGNALGVAVMVTVVTGTLTAGDPTSFPAACLVLAALGGIATVVGRLASRATPPVDPGAVAADPVRPLPRTVR